MAGLESYERSPLLHASNDRRVSRLIQRDEDARTTMADTSLGERLPYNDYTTIDQLHDLVKDSYRLRLIRSRKGIRNKTISLFDAASGWIAAAGIGCLTAVVAYFVDVCVATFSDWKSGYCKSKLLLSREACCADNTALTSDSLHIAGLEDQCPKFRTWSSGYASSFAIYVAFAIAFGITSSSLTMLTKRALPAAIEQEDTDPIKGQAKPITGGKPIYMAAGSGIPEIKTILSGFVIPNYLDLKVLLVKALGAVFAVSTAMCLGKEGPFVHISTCVGYLVASRFSKYRDNGRKMREMLSASCAAGLSVAFGAPIGGVLFSYEEISTYFTRKVLWRAFFCSLCASAVLKALNPTGTGKLVLVETNYGTSYDPIHYLVFVVLGIAGGVFGGAFCKLNLHWSKWFRSFGIIKNYPLFEVALIVLVTSLFQHPNPLTKVVGDRTVSALLADCRDDGAASSWVCQSETNSDWGYKGLLIGGTLTKLALTIITFGVKVPSGVIIPALDGGALFGRLIGQWIPGISPGIFAMVGAAAFLAGVSRMTISLCVITFELTGELEYILPNMIAILVAKWVADVISKEGVYDVAQALLGHPFLDSDHSMRLVQQQNALVEDLLPPDSTMENITVAVPKVNRVTRKLLEAKLDQLRNRGLMDAGLVLEQNGRLQGYIAQAELDFGLNELGQLYPPDAGVRLLRQAEEGEYDMSHFVDRTPPSICDKAPMEYALEMFSKLGLRLVKWSQKRAPAG